MNENNGNGASESIGFGALCLLFVLVAWLVDGWHNVFYLVLLVGIATFLGGVVGKRDEGG